MKYFLGTTKGEYREVTKEEYVIAERENGFYNTLGYPDDPATSAFVGPSGLRGYTEFESIKDFNVPRRPNKIPLWDEVNPPGAYNDYP